MARFTDEEYLQSDQYADESNLGARANLHEQFSTSDEEWFRWVFDQFDVPEDGRVLEVGCGPGYLWKENLDRVPPRWSVTLTDLSSGMVADARERLDDSQFTFETADCQDLPFATDSFDVIVANHMLYHVPDTDTAFAEFRRVLEPDGHLYAATNGRTHMQDLYELVEEFQSDSVTRRIDSEEFRLENGREQLAAWFEDVSLRRYEDSLRVTEADPLVAYVDSGLAFDLDDVSAFHEFVHERIDTDGAIDIEKATGLFVASQP